LEDPYVLNRLRILASLASVGIVLALSAPTTRAATESGMPKTAAEKAFVSEIQTDLTARFPTASDAEKAGYHRYTNADDTGAISYANFMWTSVDAKHPSQLWYDRSGALLGADFSRPLTPKPPSWLGIAPSRWVKFEDHIHYVERDAKTGKLLYDKYVSDKDFIAAGGSMTHPSAATLVKVHKVASPSQVALIFDSPAFWDLIVWVKPNPLGAFAEKNPSVDPKG
jgi:hypothetical protein